MSFTTPLIIEQHIHGAFGIDFNTAQKPDDIIFVADELLKRGIYGFFPTLVTDSIDNIKQQIKIIKDAAKCCDRILGIHLEGVFINPEKKGIHNTEHFLELTVENYKLIEDDFIKIVTLAPEKDITLIDYLKNKGIKVQAGHCITGDLSKVDGVTHIFNAMTGINQRSSGTALSALLQDNIYTELIADGIHLNDDILKLILKVKPLEKIILISDALPITASNIKETTFADSIIYYDGNKATSANGTIAGSTKLLDEIIEILISKDMFNPIFVENIYRYHNINPKGQITWNDNGKIQSIEY